MTQPPRPDDQDNVFFWWRIQYCSPVMAIINNSAIEEAKNLVLSIISSQMYYGLSDFATAWNSILDENDQKGENKIDLPENTINFLKQIAAATTVPVIVLQNGRFVLMNQ